MNRRQFLKPFVATTALSLLPRGLFSAEVPAYVLTTPRTPFDAPEGTWSLVVFPDSQNLTETHPQVFLRQAQWVAQHKESHHIRFVAHLGDITNHNNHPQWLNARNAYDLLLDAGIPFSLLPGNHDLGTNGRADDRSTLLNEYFRPNDYKHSKSVSFFEDGKMENSAHVFDSPTGKIMVVALEFGPRDAVVEWAHRVIGSHPELFVILTTHAYLHKDGTRFDFASHGENQGYNPKSYALAAAGDTNDAEDLWQKLISHHAHIRLVLCGHVFGDGAEHLISPGKDGRSVHQILSNYQAGVAPKRPWMGGGFIRLMQFLPDRRTIRVRSYSPWSDQFLTTPDQQFEIRL